MSIEYKIAPFKGKTEIEEEKNKNLTEKYYKDCVVNYKDVGFDLFCFENIIVPARAISFKIGLGISVLGMRTGELSSFMIYPRSSMGAKTPLRLCNSIGLVDPGYTGELLLFVDNMSKESYEINRKKR